jgi:hypothetical protein
VREKDGHCPPNKNGRSYPLLGILDDEGFIETRQRVGQPDQNLFASPPFRAPRARRESSVHRGTNRRTRQPEHKPIVLLAKIKQANDDQEAEQTSQSFALLEDFGNACLP